MYKIISFNKKTGKCEPVTSAGRELKYNTLWEALAIIDYLKKHDSLASMPSQDIIYCSELFEEDNK